MSLLGNVLLREVPASLLEGVARGEFRVCGSVIQSVTSGHIIGHLQETSALTSMLASANPISVTGVLAQGVSVVQNEQIKATLKFLETLQFANLAVTGLSIGVSVAGTALLLHRISRIQSKVNDIAQTLDEISTKIDDLRQDKVSDDFTRLSTLSNQVEEAWLPSSTSDDWKPIARDAHLLADQFMRRAFEIRETPTPYYGEPFLQAYALASSLRVTARLGAGQDDMGLQAAIDSAETLASFGANLNVAALALEQTTIRDGDLTLMQSDLAAAVDDINPVISVIRQRELAAAATVETLQELVVQQIRGKDWLSACRAETRNPILFLPAS
jgi:hypothetical protein